jgi:MFS family permease
MDSASGRSSVDDIVARLERLPTSWWQVKARIIVGVATFFDAFDALAIASILPVIVPLWKLTPPQIGLMISAGFLGQLLGALLFGWIAERYGRMTAMIWSIALFGIMSLVCALAWDYNSLLVFRTFRGSGSAVRYRSPPSSSANSRKRKVAAASCSSTNSCSRSAWSRQAWWACGSCPISAGNTCSSSARCRRC